MGANIQAPWIMGKKEMDGPTKLHRFRYHIGRGFVEKQDTVLDIGCGQGYGSEILSRVAKKVISVDMSEKDIVRNKDKFREIPNVEFVCANAEKMTIPTVNVACIFDVIEHFYEPQAFINKLKKAVDKWIIASVPLGEELIEVDGDIRAKTDWSHHSVYPKESTLDDMFQDEKWYKFSSFREGVFYLGIYYNIKGPHDYIVSEVK